MISSAAPLKPDRERIKHARSTCYRLAISRGITMDYKEWVRPIRRRVRSRFDNTMATGV